MEIYRDYTDSSPSVALLQNMPAQRRTLLGRKEVDVESDQFNEPLLVDTHLLPTYYYKQVGRWAIILIWAR